MKQTYHTDIIIQYKLGILNTAIQQQIPTSTLYNWRKRDVNQLFGTEYASEFTDRKELIKAIVTTKQLLQAAKALYKVYCTYSELLDSLKNKKQILKANKDKIISTIDKVVDTLGKHRALKAFSISGQQYYAWKNQIACKQNTIVKCRKKKHNQLTLKEVETIREYLKKDKYRHWNITPIYYQILRDKAAFFSKTTFYRYTKLLKLERAKPKKKSYDVGIRCESPKKMLHMDVTIYRPLDHSKLYIYFLVDNFSRKILGFKVSHQYSSKISLENIREAYYKHNLMRVKPHIDLITDGGSENKGEVDVFVNAPDSNIRRLIAQTDIIQSNSMVDVIAP